MLRPKRRSGSIDFLGHFRVQFPYQNSYTANQRKGDLVSDKITAIVAADGSIVRIWRYESADRNPARVYLASLSSGSRSTMEHALDVVAGIVAPKCGIDNVPWHLLRYQHTSAIRAVLAERYDYRTANKMLSALRQVVKHAWRLDLCTADEYMKACDIKSIEGTRPDQAETGRAVTSGELRTLVEACDDGTLTGVRDTAMLAVAYCGGLRRAEMASLDVDSLSIDTGVITVKGKRNTVRKVPLTEGAQDALRDWLDVRGTAPGALFTRIGKGAKLTHNRLSMQAVYSIFNGRAKQARVPKFSPHDLRRTFAGDMLDAGVDIVTVQKLMGHKSVTTTASYDRRGERAKKEAAKKIHFPYQSKRE